MSATRAFTALPLYDRPRNLAARETLRTILFPACPAPLAGLYSPVSRGLTEPRRVSAPRVTIPHARKGLRHVARLK